MPLGIYDPIGCLNKRSAPECAFQEYCGHEWWLDPSVVQCNSHDPKRAPLWGRNTLPPSPRNAFPFHCGKEGAKLKPRKWGSGFPAPRLLGVPLPQHMTHPSKPAAATAIRHGPACRRGAGAGAQRSERQARLPRSHDDDPGPPLASPRGGGEAQAGGCRGLFLERERPILHHGALAALQLPASTWSAQAAGARRRAALS